MRQVVPLKWYNQQMNYSYPLTIHFRLIAVAPRVSVKDADGNEILYIEQKLFALREAVKVFNNAQDKKLLYTMKANQVIDFGAKYIIRDAKDKELGSVQQAGVRSLLQASYTLADSHDKQLFQIIQTNPLMAILDSLISIIPFAELLTNFILNPTYTLSKHNEKESIMQMKKKPSFFEASFQITKPEQQMTKDQELLVLLSYLMIVQLERNRG